MVNGEAFQNDFLSLKDWTLKKKFNCRKCNIELGLFINNNKQEKLIWLEFLSCEEPFLPKLTKLYEKKKKYREVNKENEYIKTIKEIESIQNLIRSDQTKIRIKVRIENKGLVV